MDDGKRLTYAFTNSWLQAKKTDTLIHNHTLVGLIDLTVGTAESSLASPKRQTQNGKFGDKMAEKEETASPSASDQKKDGPMSYHTYLKVSFHENAYVFAVSPFTDTVDFWTGKCSLKIK